MGQGVAKSHRQHIIRDLVHTESQNVGISRTQNIECTNVLNTNVLNLYYRRSYVFKDHSFYL